jgi:hypothetical protein
LCKINTNVATGASSRTRDFRRKFAETAAALPRHRRARPTFLLVSANIAHTIVGVWKTADFDRAVPDRQVSHV